MDIKKQKQLQMTKTHNKIVKPLTKNYNKMKNIKIKTD